jgi:hypothetical protein
MQQSTITKIESNVLLTVGLDKNVNVLLTVGPNKCQLLLFDVNSWKKCHIYQ